MIKIFTTPKTRPDFLEIQIKSLKKYLQEDYEFIVFNNANFDQNKSNYNKINQICEEHKISVTDVTKDQKLIDFLEPFETAIGNTIFGGGGEYLNPNVTCAYSLCYGWREVIKSNMKTCFLAPDVFLMEPVVFSEYLDEYQLCFIPQRRKGAMGEPINYMLNSFFLVDVPNVSEPENINWWCGSVHGTKVDVGGQTHTYLEKYPDINKFEMGDPMFGPFNAQRFTIKDKSVLHYLRGSNWDNQTNEFHNVKTEWVNKVLDI